MLMRSYMLRWCVVLSVLFLVSACGGSSRTTAPQQAAPADINAFLQDALETAPRLAYDDLVARLGLPARVKTEPMAGPNAASQQDTLRTMIYYGLEVALHEGAAPSRLAHFALTDARYTSPEGLRVGYAESEVLSTLGRPTRREPALLVYEKETPQPCILMVFLEHRTISRMEWRFGRE